MIRFPRRLRLGFKPWYGLTLRQLFYLLIAAVIAGGIVLTGSGEGADLVVRLLIGLPVILVGAVLAFYRIGGLSVEQWLIAKIQFWLHPQYRVWTRGGGRSILPPDQGLEEIPQSPRIPNGQAAPLGVAQPDAALATQNAQAFVVILDLFVLFSLFTLTVYLDRRGLSDIQMWVSMVTNR